MVVCPYCNNEAELVKGDKVYPHRPDLYNLNFWYCNNGHSPAYVGCHKGGGGTNPLGRLANAALRSMKSRAHAAFDPLWKGKTFKSRGQAYRWLSDSLGIPKEDCHIGMFDEEMCKRVINICTTKTTRV